MKRYPIKPVKARIVQETKTFDQKTAIEILKEFYLMASNEINGRTTVSLHQKAQHGSLSFVCDGFNLKLEFTEGGVRA